MKEHGENAELFRDAKYRGIVKKTYYKADDMHIDSLPAGFKFNNRSPVEVHSVLGIKDVYYIDWTYSFAEVKKTLPSKKHISNNDKSKAKKPNKRYKTSDIFEAELTLKIPYPARKSNADKITSPTEYHWNLIKPDGKGEVRILLEYVHYNVNVIIGYLALLIAVVSFIILTKILKRDDVTY